MQSNSQWIWSVTTTGLSKFYSGWSEGVFNSQRWWRLLPNLGVVDPTILNLLKSCGKEQQHPFVGWNLMSTGFAQKLIR